MGNVTHLLILAVGAGRVDVKGRGVQAADVGRTFARCIDHVQLGEQGNVTQVTSVVHRSLAANRRCRRLLVLQQLASKLSARLQLGHEPDFLRIALSSSHRILAFA